MGGVEHGVVAATPRRGRLATALAGLAAVSALSAACVAPVAVSNAIGLRGASGETGPLISVRQESDDAPPPGCAPPSDALRYATLDTAESFTLRITVAASLCAPITAVAAIYRMPGNGVAWPQDLVERQEFQLASAGATEVVFTKTCLPAQFDVVTGATPERIAPWAERHGPLLFPGDTRTASQHWGGPCGGGTTPTTAPPSVAPTSIVPSDGVPTTPPSGPGPSVPGGSGPTTPPSASGVPTEVLGATTVPTELASVATPDTPVTVVDSGSGDPPRVAGLALTGTSIAVLVAAGLVLLLAGVTVQIVPRRIARRRNA